jgi:hypothetical protein
MRLIVGFIRVVAVVALLLLLASNPNTVIGLRVKVPKKNAFETKRTVNIVAIANVRGNCLLPIVLNENQ